MQMQRGMVDEERGPGMDGRDRKYKCKRPVYKIAWDAVRLESGGGGWQPAARLAVG